MLHTCGYADSAELCTSSRYRLQGIGQSCRPAALKGAAATLDASDCLQEDFQTYDRDQ